MCDNSLAYSAFRQGFILSQIVPQAACGEQGGEVHILGDVRILIRSGAKSFETLLLTKAI